MSNNYKTIQDFYPYYLNQHCNRTSRRLHFIGTSISLIMLILALIAQSGWLVIIALIQGYTLAWIGHFFFEQNKPATFRHPWLSFQGDWCMWWDILTSKIRF